MQSFGHLVGVPSFVCLQQRYNANMLFNWSAFLQYLWSWVPHFGWWSCEIFPKRSAATQNNHKYKKRSSSGWWSREICLVLIKDLEKSAQRVQEQLEWRTQSTCTHLWFLNTHNYNKQWSWEISPKRWGGTRNRWFINTNTIDNDLERFAERCKEKTLLLPIKRPCLGFENLSHWDSELHFVH